ncbi:MAG TPA: hypothetical protein DCS05_09195 [Nitrospiraceae bacterium]|nr:hypothetical protein [Nitrospiraceae bacterium]
MVRIACEVLAGLAASRMDHITKIGDGGDRAQPSRGTERKSIPDAAGAAKYTPVSPVADECASPPDPTIRKDQQ